MFVDSCIVFYNNSDHNHYNSLSLFIIKIVIFAKIPTVDRKQSFIVCTLISY